MVTVKLRFSLLQFTHLIYSIGCDPDDFPTASYIEKFSEAYNNPNLTTWVDDYGQTMPKNRCVLVLLSCPDD